MDQAEAKAQLIEQMRSSLRAVGCPESELTEEFMEAQVATLQDRLRKMGKAFVELNRQANAAFQEYLKAQQSKAPPAR